MRKAAELHQRSRLWTETLNHSTGVCPAMYKAVSTHCEWKLYNFWCAVSNFATDAVRHGFNTVIQAGRSLAAELETSPAWQLAGLTGLCNVGLCPVVITAISLQPFSDSLQDHKMCPISEKNLSVLAYLIWIYLLSVWENNHVVCIFLLSSHQCQNTSINNGSSCSQNSRLWWYVLPRLVIRVKKTPREQVFACEPLGVWVQICGPSPFNI